MVERGFSHQVRQAAMRPSILQLFPYDPEDHRAMTPNNAASSLAGSPHSRLLPLPPAVRTGRIQVGAHHPLMIIPQNGWPVNYRNGHPVSKEKAVLTDLRADGGFRPRHLLACEFPGLQYRVQFCLGRHRVGGPGTSSGFCRRALPLTAHLRHGILAWLSHFDVT